MIINNTHIKLKRFSSKELKLIHSDLTNLIKDNTVEIIYKGEESIFELMICCSYYKSINTKVILYLSYLPYQRMDHDSDFEVKTLEHVANLLNKLNLDKIYILEPHCDISLINNGEKISSVTNLFFKYCKDNNFDKEKDILIFTDYGSYLKYKHLANNFIYFEKHRNKFSGLIESHSLIGKIDTNRKFLLLDDIISSGDTVESCLKLLPDNIKIDIISGHFEKNKYNKRLFFSKKINMIYSTDSLQKKGNKKLKLIKVEDIIYGKI